MPIDILTLYQALQELIEQYPHDLFIFCYDHGRLSRLVYANQPQHHQNRPAELVYQLLKTVQDRPDLQAELLDWLYHD